MSGAVNSTFLSNLANPPAASPQYWQQQMANMNALQDYQAKQATAQAYQQSVNPDGSFNQGKFNALLASGPGAWNAGPAMQQAGQAVGAQATAAYNQAASTAAHMKLLGQSAMLVVNDPSDANVNASIDNLKANGLPADQMEAERARWLAMSKPDRQKNAYALGLQSLDQLHQVIGQTTGQNIGGQIVPITTTQPGVGGQPGGIRQGPGAVTLGISPEDANTIVQVPYPQFLEDGKTPNPNWGKTFPMRKADVLPLLTPGPGGGSAGQGGGTTGLPPSLRNPANQPPATPPASGTATPAPSGAPTGTPPAGPPISAGQAIIASPGAAAPALPLPPTPPANVPPAAAPAPPAGAPTPAPGTPAGPAAPIWNPNNAVGTSTVTPATANPAIAAAQSQAKASGRPVPIPGMSGMVAYPNGGIGTPGGIATPAPSAAPTPPAGRPFAATQGGVPVASVNALAPALGAAAPPSPAVSGDVRAIMAGMQRGATPTAGAQAAGPAATTYFGTGPSAADIEQQRQQVQQGMTGFQAISDQAVASRPRSAILGNMLADTSQFTTGPLTERIAAVRNIANRFGIPVNTEGLSAQESFNKLAAQLANAQGAGSDARLNVNVAANPHQELSPQGVDLMLRQLQGNEDYIQARARLAASYGDQTNVRKFESDVGTKVDPRAFQFARMTPQQRQTYNNGLSTADKAAVRSSYNWLHAQGLVSD